MCPMARVVVLGVKTGVCFVQQDVTEEMPSGPFDVILSRYAVCLYLQTTQLSEVLPEMLNRLRPGGFLVIGAKDHLPNGIEQRYGLVALDYKQGDARCIFQKQPTSLPTPRMRGCMFKMIYLSSIVYYDVYNIYDIMIINYCHMSHIGQLFLMKELDGLDSSVEIFCRRCETRFYVQFVQRMGGEPYWVAEQKQLERQRRAVRMRRGFSDDFQGEMAENRLSRNQKSRDLIKMALDEGSGPAFLLGFGQAGGMRRAYSHAAAARATLHGSITKEYRCMQYT